MRYEVWARISRQFSRATNTSLYDSCYGTYKRLKNAKKKATELRKHRAIFDFFDGRGYVDCGPTFTRKTVRIVPTNHSDGGVR